MAEIIMIINRRKTSKKFGGLSQGLRAKGNSAEP